ncbi:MAG: hypothetical protein ACK4X1_11730, partial [Terricaulis sp.]
AARRLKGALAQAGVATPEDEAELRARAANAEAAGERPPKEAKRMDKAYKRAAADFMTPMSEAERLGAALPPVRTLLKTSWRIELADVPPGEAFVEAVPAYVVRFDGNAPLARLRRAGVLQDHQVRAGEKVCALYLAAVKPPKLVASYDGVIAQGGAAPRPWIEAGTDAWRSLEAGLNGLLPEEAEAVMEVAVYETTIETLASRSRPLVRFTKRL